MKLGSIYVYCFIIFNFYVVSAQHIKIQDTSSIENKLKYKLYKLLDESNYKKALIITDSMEIYGAKNSNSLFLAYAYDAKTMIYRFRQDLPKAKAYVKKSIQIYEEHKRYNSLVALNAHLANILRAEGKLDSCLIVLNTISRKYITDTTSKKNLRYFYNEKDISHSLAGRIDSSFHYTFKKIALTNEDDYYGLGVSYTILAKNFYTVNDLPKALIYIDKSIDYLSMGAYSYDVATCRALILKGKILLSLNRYTEVEQCANSITALIKNKNQPEYKAQANILLSKLYRKRKQFEKIPSIDFFVKKHKNISFGTLFEFYNLKLEQAIYHTSWKEAGELIEKLDHLTSKISGLKSKQSFYKLSSIYWAAIKDFEKSYYSQNQHLQIKEKINTRQQTYMAYDLDQRYQLAKKNKEIALQNFKIKEQENQLLLKKKHQTYLSISILSAILAFISLLFVYRQRQKIKDNEILALQRRQEIIRLESLISGEEKERNRLAQDLHDGINGDLSAIKYKFTSIKGSKLDKKEKVIHKEAIAMLDNTVEQVRRISHNLAPSSLQNFDLVKTIKQFCNKISFSHSLQVSFQHFGNKIQLDKQKENAIYRIVQELINNVVKHAEASEALVQVNQYKNKVHITVEDNGKGFDPNIKSDGIGLQNIKSRVSFLKADLDIISEDQGTSFHIIIDLNKI